MATKKKAAKKSKATLVAIDRSVLKFNPKWFTDPGPDGYKALGTQVARQIAQLKADFAKQYNAIVNR
jgi:hypothetical protein